MKQREDTKTPSKVSLLQRKVEPLRLPGGRKKVNKYNAGKTADGYASGLEARRARELRLMEREGLIKDLREQVKFNLIPKQLDETEVTKRGKPRVLEHACDYIADFVYTDVATGKEVVEDTKGVRTPEYVIKRKLMLYLHLIRIKEIDD